MSSKKTEQIQPNENKATDSSSKEKTEISLFDKWNEQMKLIEDKTGIKGIYVITLLLTSIVLVYLNVFDKLITNLVGTLYPAFWTMKSIELKNDDDKMWLTYWVVFSSFTLVDMFSVMIVKFIPFYFVLKILFLIWLFMPNSQGCYIVYKLLVKRVFKSFEEKIDGAADKFKNVAQEYMFTEENFKQLGRLKEGFKNYVNPFKDDNNKKKKNQ
jgi:receptor expression-enhancing protein 5/6